MFMLIHFDLLNFRIILRHCTPGEMYRLLLKVLLCNLSTALGSNAPGRMRDQVAVSLEISFLMNVVCLSKFTHLFLTFSSVSSSYFICAVPMHKYLGKHSYLCSTFPKAILTGTCYFHTVKAVKNWKQCFIKIILVN